MILYRLIDAPLNGRKRIFGINGLENSYLRKIIFMIGTEESNNESTRMNSASIILTITKT